MPNYPRSHVSCAHLEMLCVRAFTRQAEQSVEFFGGVGQDLLIELSINNGEELKLSSFCIAI